SAPSRPGLRRGGGPRTASRACTAPRRLAPTARAAGRTRAPPPRRREAARSRAARSPAPQPGRRAPLPNRPCRASSYLDDDGQDERPLPHAVVDELPDPVVQVLLEQLDLDDLLVQALVQHALRLGAHLLEQRLRLGEASRDQ